MAYEIINRFKNKGNLEMLIKQSSLVTIREKKKGQLHKVFEESFDAKPIISHPFLLQKINYIHNNPITGKWMLAKEFTAYEHSSISFYQLLKLQHFMAKYYLDIKLLELQTPFSDIYSALNIGVLRGVNGLRGMFDKTWLGHKKCHIECCLIYLIIF